MSAAIVSMVFASCTNEELVNQTTDGRMFTLEVSQGMDSRTTLTQTPEGYQTLWSAGDQIYVTSEDGKTTGVLTLDPQDAGKPSGSFSGYVFGKGELKYSVFPVPANGVIDLNNSNEGQIDAPMVGTIGQNSTIFTNACAMVNLDIDGLPQNAEVSVSNTDIVTSATFDIETGTLKPIATSAKTVVVKSSDESVLVPLFINPATTATDFDLTVSVNGKSCVIENIQLEDKKVSANSIPDLQYTNVAGENHLVVISEPAEGEDATDVLEKGQSVVITEETASDDNTYTIGNSETPTVITFDHPITSVTIKAAEGENTPSQPVKVVIAGGVTEQLTPDQIITIDFEAELVYQVNSSEQLPALLTNLTDAGSANTSVEIATDIDLSNVEWTPVKVDGYHGSDIITIDGNYHTITGLSSPLFAGGFAGGSGIVIKNLTIADSKITSKNTTGSGAFIESSDSMDEITLFNCHLLNSSVTGSRTGGLIGWTSGYSNINDGPVKTYVTIEKCSVIECDITGTSVGGINGHAGASDWTYTTIKDCTVKDCNLNSTDAGDWRVGVVVGTANVGEVTISNITESGNVLTQTGKTAPAEQSNLYGRFVPGTTGKLTIDGKEIK